MRERMRFDEEPQERSSYHCLQCGEKVWDDEDHECAAVQCSQPKSINDCCMFRGGTIQVTTCNFPEGFCPRV